MRSQRAFVAVVAVIAALVVQNPLAAVAAPAGIGIRLLDAPVSAANDPRAHIYIVDQLAPGTTITRHVRVTNSSAKVADASVYPAAASISGGQFRFADGRTANELTSWTSVTPPVATLAAGASADATVRIAIPADATSGERYAVIWAQIASPVVAGAISQVSRVGVRVYLDVSGDRQPAKFAISGIAASRDRTGRPWVTAQVHNTGPRAVDIAGTVDLSNGPGGLRTGPVNTSATVTIAPGGSQSVSAGFDARLLAGPWLMTVNLASGTVHEQATATATFPAVATAPVQASMRPARSSSWVLVVLGSLLALIVLGAATWLLLRQRRGRARPAQ